MNESSSYYLRWRGRQSGPCTLAEINRKLDEHEIGMGHEIQYEDRWISVEEFLQTVSAHARPANAAPAKPSAAPIPVPVPAAPPPAPQRFSISVQPSMPLDSGGAKPRRRLVFAGLAVLAGFTGVHNFYARHWLTGVIQLLVSVASYLLGFGVVAPWLWAMVEALAVRRDGFELEMT